MTNRDYQNFLRAHSIIDAVGERADRAYTHVTSFDSRRQWMICDSLARKRNLSEQGTPQARLLGFVVLRGSPQLLLRFPEEADLRHLSL